VRLWILLGWLCVFYLAGLCFLSPLTPSVRIAGKERVLVRPRGGGEGVVVRQLTHGLTRVHLIDADLRTSGVTVRVHARRPSSREWGWSVGDALRLSDWCRATGAIAGVNGGFFGAEVSPGRKEVIGLLKVDGVTYARAPVYRSHADRSITYAHSTFGVLDGRLPLVGWVVSDPRSRARLRAFPHPEGLSAGRLWQPDDALSGGPRLIHEGRRFVAASDERLCSVGALPRTFLGYSQGNDGKGARLVLVTASAMTYREAANFLLEYFRERHGSACEEAMCLDGGPSSQLAYRSGTQVLTAHAETVTVPTCILIHDQTVSASRVTRLARKSTQAGARPLAMRSSTGSGRE
jgi:Phosphodiester glycosidase